MNAPSTDVSYILGALHDGSLLKNQKRGEYYIEFEQKNKEWLLNSVAPRLERVFGVKCSMKQRKNGLFQLRAYSKEMYNELKSLESVSILNWSGEAQRSYIRGYADAEGSVHKRDNRLTIYQKNKNELDEIKQVLLEHGIRPGKMICARDLWELPIYGKRNLQLFCEIIGLEHPDKLAILLIKV